MGVALPPKSDAMYGSKRIPPYYARVNVSWTNSEFDKDEINIPTLEGFRFIGGILSMEVLWNRSNNILDVPMLASARSQPSPMGDPSDDDDDDNSDDDNGGDNDNAGGPGSSP